ncbi:MAG TPA: tetratricopeptide repeat protein [Polyangiaceae bacterium]|nr:tetratricopeptide repeat protein [Polyangiaceae bacterium]
MLKVECESCKAPYQIDERRVPPAGLKMRCPKCGHSFLVTNPNAPAAAAPVAPPAPPVAPAAGRPPQPPPPPPGVTRQRTIVGIAPPVPAAAPPAPAAPTQKMPMAAPTQKVPVAAPKPPPAPVPQAPPAPPPAQQRAPIPSDFPPALGSLDESDLPVVSAGLPAPAVPKPPPVPRAATPQSVAPEDIELDLDLPAVAADLPVARQGERADLPVVRKGGGADLPVVRKGGGAALDVDLPIVAANLPVPAAGLPVVAAAGLPVTASSAGLPVVAANLPVPAASLPVPAASLPMPAASLPTARGFGEIDLPSIAESLPTAAESLPTAAESLPSKVAPDQHLPSRPSQPSGGFGEFDLPREPPAASPALGMPPQPLTDSADFGDLQLEDKPRSGKGSGSNVSAVARLPTGEAASGGMSFGEVDFGGGGAEAGAPEPAIGVDTAGLPAQSFPPPGPPVQAAATAPVSVRPPVARERAAPASQPPPRKRSGGKYVALGILVAAILGGASMQLTQYGAFGYLAIGDLVHAKDYAAALASDMASTEKSLSTDTYDDARSAADAALAAHSRSSRARPMTAYAAVVDFATTVRFGADPARVPRGKELVTQLVQAQAKDVKYLDVAQAAQLAEGGDWAKARPALASAAGRYPGDPIQLDIAVLRGDVELAAKDANAALAAFKAVQAPPGDARVHFGLARAYDALGDGANAKKEIEATLAASPMHPGALTLRARMKSARVDDAQALKDLSTVLDGPARTKASPVELSNAYAAKAWVSLERGAASDARDAFAQAVKIDPRNVAALNGEGRLLLNEGRYTEALSRFDTALQFDPSSPETMANDAEAKIDLERLADAKAQLTDARTKFPKSIQVLLLLGRVEQKLGNMDASEQVLRTAMSYADPTRSDAVLPYVALSELLSARGHTSDAKSVLDDAKKKLPPSAALDRAVGDVAMAQGEYDAAITQYRSALAKDPHDVATHFQLAVVLRRVRKFDDAGTELDRVAAVDKDYPGLSLERGLLYEESGDVDKAIDQFKAALAKAPDDPDLQLRVGSAYVMVGRPDDALPMLHKVLDKRPTSAEAHHYIGRALMLQGQGQQQEALRFLKRAVDLDPNRAEFHVYLAWAANDAQPAQLELARDEIDRALAIDKMSAEAYWQKGVLERMEGAIDDAIKDERHALELRPSRYEAHATLAECYEDKNDEGTAIGEWARAIAGDGNATNSDGTIPHPYWRYRYGKLQLEHGATGAALAQLLPAAQTGEKLASRPGWLAPAEFLTAEALRKSGRRSDAAEHYQRFLEIAPVNSPDRADAQKALAALKPGG